MTDLPVTSDIPTWDVSVKNWADMAKPPEIASTSVHTYTIDPAATPTANNDARRTQIASYEPNRYRMVVTVIDSPVMLVMDTPASSPEPSTVSQTSAGRYLANGLFEYVFYGPDAFYINSITGGAASRVTVTKEYFGIRERK